MLCFSEGGGLFVFSCFDTLLHCCGLGCFGGACCLVVWFEVLLVGFIMWGLWVVIVGCCGLDFVDIVYIDVITRLFGLGLLICLGFIVWCFCLFACLCSGVWVWMCALL